MSNQKRKAEKPLAEETPIKKKLNTQDSTINMLNNDRNHDSPSTMPSPIENAMQTETPITVEEQMTKSKPGPKRTEKNSYDEIHKAYLSDPNSFVDTYKIVKYKGNIYHIAENLLIRNEADANNDFICKLLRIIRPLKPESLKVLAFLEVQWYYRKTDLPKKYNQFFKAISKSELFLSNHKDFIMVDCINGTCQVLSLEEYDKLNVITPNIFFSRGTYDIMKKKVIPAIEAWPKHCVCSTPLNPDYMYIQCDHCDSWYHTECVNLSDDEAKTIDKWLCSKCDKNKEERSKEKEKEKE
jgi:hypothetical protein